jgi:hypothetical protein
MIEVKRAKNGSPKANELVQRTNSSDERRELGERLDGDPLEFDVTVRDANSESHHHVTIDRKTCERLSGGHTPEHLLEAAFRFLLDREPKESILARFDVSVIARYFPEYERELLRYL